jgi:DSF synthase
MNPVAEFPMLATLKPHTQIQIEFDPELQALYSWMKPNPRPCFNAVMLEEIKRSEKLLKANAGYINHHGQQQQVDYLVVGSRLPGVFNLGGDLNMFIQAIMRNDRELLMYYANLCVDNQFSRATGCDGLVTSIALVQGKALGGGFECALACDVIVSESSATFSLPEVQFNLFPGMGALSFLGRKIGLKPAEDVITSGRIYTATELHDLGVIDEVVDDGYGEEAVRTLIARRQRRGNTYRAMQLAKRRFNPIPETELREIVQIWVDAALRLEERDLRLMARLVKAQDKMMSTLSPTAALEDLYGIPTLPVQAA